VICCPIYASDDLAMAAKEQMASFPRCVVMLINKVPDAQTMHKIRMLGEHSAELMKQSCRFEAQDLEKCELVCSFMGRIHDVVN